MKHDVNHYLKCLPLNTGCILIINYSHNFFVYIHNIMSEIYTRVPWSPWSSCKAHGMRRGRTWERGRYLPGMSSWRLAEREKSGRLETSSIQPTGIRDDVRMCDYWETKSASTTDKVIILHFQWYNTISVHSFSNPQCNETLQHFLKDRR